MASIVQWAQQLSSADDVFWRTLDINGSTTRIMYGVMKFRIADVHLLEVDVAAFEFAA